MVAPFFGFPRLMQREPEDPRHPVHPGWPEYSATVTLRDGARVRLRPLLKSDRPQWQQLRMRNQPQLQPVEPTVQGTWESAHSSGAWARVFQYLRFEAGRGTIIPFVIELDGNFVGQLTLGNIQRGVANECWIGYWVDHAVTGRGVAQAAVALGIDHVFFRVDLHRVTATYLPTNPASGAVLAANGFREEGVLRRNLHIDGQWQDHVSMAIVQDDFIDPAVERLRARGILR